MTAKYLGKRLIQMILVALGISFLSFLITYLAPGDPVRTMYATSGVVPSEDVIQQTREAMGLNRPVLVQYFDWLTGCLHGDFGTSYAYNNSVSALLLNRLWPTLKLSIFSLILMLVIAVPLGMIQATHKNSLVDYGLRGLTFFGVSMPNFWVGLLLMLFFCVRLKLLPVVCSGGDTRSRVIALEPELIIMDEATCALDVSVQKTIIQLVCRLQKEKNIAIGFIAHDLGLIQSLCPSDRCHVSGKYCGDHSRRGSGKGKTPLIHVL